MQFLIIADDATDLEALNRRMEAREAHIAHIAKAKAAGHAKMGAALLSEEGIMNGSCIIAEFNSREELDAWIATDPYVIHGVWGSLQIQACKIAPSFLG
jgi:uncharacterized protein YciI